MPCDECKRMIDALPKTADGVTIIPGMRVYYVNRAMVSNPVCWSVARRVTKNEWFDGCAGRPYYIGQGEPVFSTEQAAYQHRADGFMTIAQQAQREAEEKCQADQDERQCDASVLPHTT